MHKRKLSIIETHNKRIWSSNTTTNNKWPDDDMNTNIIITILLNNITPKKKIKHRVTKCLQTPTRHVTGCSFTANDWKTKQK